MISSQTILSEINQLNTLKNLVRAYEEIASSRMKKTRDSVLYNRQYLDKISEIFQEVRYSYAQKARRLIKKRGEKALTFLAHNGKTVAVLLSANTGLYGQIVNQTFSRFLSEVKKENVEVTIIGKQGLSLFIAALPDHPYTYLDLPDSEVKFDDLTNIIKHIVQYEEIHVYYGKFISFIKQEPSTLSISADISLDDQTQKRTAYLFEPTLEQILIFFETEIFGSLFEQTVAESALAKYASRAISMDQADLSITKKLKKLEMEKLKASHRLANRKQLNSLPRLNFLTQNSHAPNQ